MNVMWQTHEGVFLTQLVYVVCARGRAFVWVNGSLLVVQLCCKKYINYVTHGKWSRPGLSLVYYSFGFIFSLISALNAAAGTLQFPHCEIIKAYSFIHS